jgi:hypothetical protein
MAEPTVLPVILGLAVGVAFVAILGVMYVQAPLIDFIHVPLDRGKNQEIIDIMLQDPRITSILKDRDVGLFYISPPSRYDDCEFAPSARVILQTDIGFLFVMIDHFQNKVVGASMHSKDENIPLIANTYEYVELREHKEQILSAVITINPGKSYFEQFTVPDCAREIQINGTYEARGGENYVKVLLMPKVEYDNWLAGGNYTAYGWWDKGATEIIEAYAAPGDSAYLVFDNSFSNSTKIVSADFELSYRK